MTHRYPRGSEWRKWDLHVHAPETKLSDGYRATGETSTLEEFCQVIHDSDVAVVAIADYFSFDCYFAVKGKFEEMFPDDETLILANLELRLPVSVNKAGEKINMHLIFSPELTKATANKFLGRLNTEGTKGPDRTTVTCADLVGRGDFESATVSHKAIDTAIRDTFGEHAVVPNRRQEHLLVFVSGKGDGIRPGGSGRARKNLLTDEIDKYCDGIFSNSGSRDHFLDVNRLESDEPVAAKPVLDGCDAHSFKDLLETLGKHHTAEGNYRSPTWIKADPSYSGLLQALIEPADRVAIRATAPDRKEPYKVISSVKFSGTQDFPEEIVFNQNLNSIIGSRSSGKSALLAYIAHSVDADETIRKQLDAIGSDDERRAGPAAGLNWQEVQDIKCEVEWGHGEESSGKVIFIPQNSLYRLSEQPEDITRKIEPALFRSYPLLRAQFDQAQSTVASKNKSIQDAVYEWFEKASQIDVKIQEIKNLGDKKAIEKERDRLQGEVTLIQSNSQLSDEEMVSFQDVSNQLKQKEARLAEIDSEVQQLAAYVVFPDGDGKPEILEQSVSAMITITPTGEHFSEALQRRVAGLREQAKVDLESKIESELLEAAESLLREKAAATAMISGIKEGNAKLLDKHQANEELAKVVAAQEKQTSSLDSIIRAEENREKLRAAQQNIAEQIQSSIAERGQALSTLQEQFRAEPRVLSDLRFEIETGVPNEKVTHAARAFNRRRSSDYISSSEGEAVVEFKKAQEGAGRFMQQLQSKKIVLNSGYDSRSVATDVLTITAESRFSAELDSDRIGGFEKSSMTPGKQALFALTLILNESQEPWPLLIDQPEDDLDSRSIYETIVPYLVTRKKERQIIMVSHNANLVIGADSEQVTVANRHGDDRKNRSGRMFNYFTGSLEHSAEDSSAAYELERWGIREHAVEILDGGEEAFQKRREKYKLPLGS